MNEHLLYPQGNITPADCVKAADDYGTPLYFYDEAVIVSKCRELLSMPSAFGLRVRYAMKANSSRALLQLIAGEGLLIDASSLNEARRAVMAGIPHGSIMLTTQEIPSGEDRLVLEAYMRKDMKYNICSFRQLEAVADYAANNSLSLSMRVHPGVGSGESATRNTGDKYSCFGIHLTDLERSVGFAREKGLVIDEVHVHIGSGGDPVTWKENIDRELGFLETYFPDATTVNFGGGLREARMPDERPADIMRLGDYAKQQIEAFGRRTGRKLRMEVEPGTYVIARAGYLVTRVIDFKQTGEDGFRFIVTDGGMETNARPLLYGSRHPFYIISRNGSLLSREEALEHLDPAFDRHIIVGRCCESGDSQCLDEHGHIVPRLMSKPEIGDIVVVGGCGAYCASMSPYNYNSHPQAPEVLLRKNGRLELIRKHQRLDQITENELPLEGSI
ncbi:MAG: diaminopimelate decarboxylase [Spirochaetales bacterium]|nr:diaminopimelate decarboxylase [Spirochaetales bacterium]